MPPQPYILCGYRGLNSGPRLCKADILPAELSSQPTVFHFNTRILPGPQKQSICLYFSSGHIQRAQSSLAIILSFLGWRQSWCGCWRPQGVEYGGQLAQWSLLCREEELNSTSRAASSWLVILGHWNNYVSRNFPCVSGQRG